MKFDDALSLYNILHKTIIGTEVKGFYIKAVFIAPTDSTKFTEFINYQIKEGESAIYHFLNDEMSVFGASEPIGGKIPRIEVVVLDDLRLEMSN